VPCDDAESGRQRSAPARTTERRIQSGWNRAPRVLDHPQTEVLAFDPREHRAGPVIASAVGHDDFTVVCGLPQEGREQTLDGLNFVAAGDDDGNAGPLA
jgi:hypothetical protein